MLKLNNRGSLHLVVPSMVVILIAIAGSYFLVAGYANNTTEPIASAAGKKCKGDLKLVNAKPSDFISGRYKSKAIRNHGLICVSKTEGREQVTGPNNNTIIDYYKCPINAAFAYDKNNPDGTGYHLRWKLQSYNGGSAHEKKTYYCVKKKDLYAARAANGVDVDNATTYMYTNRDFHNYRFYPAFSLNEACSGAKLKFSGCKQNYFFSYYGGRDVKHPK